MSAQYFADVAERIQPTTLLRTQRLAALLAHLARTAEAGDPCPNNDQIIDTIALNGAYQVSGMLTELLDANFITIERDGYLRRVTIVATGKSTDWSKRTGGRKRVGIGFRDPEDVKALAGTFRGDLPESRYVYRDPCPGCGVRRDVGCAHQPLMGVAA